MTITVDIPSQSTLTGGGTVDTLVTGGGVEFHSITFTNYSASDRTLELFINGTADVNRIGKAISLQAGGGFCVWKEAIENGTTLRARASASSSIVWKDTVLTQT